MNRSLSALLVALALALTACAGESETSTTTRSSDDGSTTTAAITTSTENVANDLEAFDRMEIVVAGESLTVAVADTPVLRAQGLMGVTDLVDVDGMLFVFDSDSESSFWMKDTLIPLDIWFFDSQGALVSTTTMTPCESDPCDRYPPDGPYRYALETEPGRIAEGSTPTLMSDRVPQDSTPTLDG